MVWPKETKKGKKKKRRLGPAWGALFSLFAFFGQFLRGWAALAPGRCRSRLADMQQALAYRISALVGFFGVALGAFGAHGLKDILARHETAATWQTAVLYHLVHAAVLLALSSAASWRRGPWLCLLGGVLVFSGSLYVLALTGVKWLGAITPIGGVLFLAGWLWLAWRGAAASKAL